VAVQRRSHPFGFRCRPHAPLLTITVVRTVY
jgi:hypothetical protein